MSAEQNNLAATVFVYRSRIDGRIQTEYLETALVMEKSPDWEHIATLEPRWWIQAHYDAVAQRDELLAELKKVLRTSKARRFVEIKTVNSAIRTRMHNGEEVAKTVHCWVFERGARRR